MFFQQHERQTVPTISLQSKQQQNTRIFQHFWTLVFSSTNPAGSVQRFIGTISFSLITVNYTTESKSFVTSFDNLRHFWPNVIYCDFKLFGQIEKQIWICWWLPPMLSWHANFEKLILSLLKINLPNHISISLSNVFLL